MTSVSSTSNDYKNQVKIPDNEFPTKCSLPHSIIERFKIFETEGLYKNENQWDILRKIIIAEQTQSQLNKKLIIAFPGELRHKFDPSFMRESNFSTQFRKFCHYAVASTVLIASLQPWFVRRLLDKQRMNAAEILLDNGFSTTRLTLQDGDGVEYDAILSGKINDIMDGSFVFRWGGNAETYEMSHLIETWENHFSGFATFQINGPGVGRSQGRPSYANIMKAAKVGLTFLETLTDHYRDRRIRSKGRIVLAGFSLGNGVFSELLRWHKLSTHENDYLVYSINTFSRLSDVPSGFFSQHIGFSWARTVSEKICFLGNRFFRWVKFDFDAVRAAHLLSNLKVPQAILQACVFDGEKLIAIDDGIVSADASLLTQIIKSKEMHRKLAASNVFYDKEVLNPSLFKYTEQTHCIDNSRWSARLLATFDEIVAWARQPSN
jgi:hypothetical protein